MENPNPINPPASSGKTRSNDWSCDNEIQASETVTRGVNAMSARIVATLGAEYSAKTIIPTVAKAKSKAK
jgi:hypothetical protein